MSSSRIIVVARNTETGKIELPMEDLTIYGLGEEETILQECRKAYTEDWVLSLYKPSTEFFIGSKKEKAR